MRYRGARFVVVIALLILLCWVFRSNVALLLIGENRNHKIELDIVDGWSNSADKDKMDLLTRTEDEQKTEIEIHNINSSSVPSQNLTLTLMILAAPTTKSYALRHCVRSTYMTLIPEKYRPRFKYFFLVGRPATDETLGTLMEEEQSRYGDLVNYPGIEAYDKLSSKVLWGFKYVADNDNDYNMIMKTDDDSFINVAKIFRDIAIRKTDLNGNFYGGPSRYPNMSGRGNFRNMIDMKNFIFPRHYCAGTAYLISKKLLEQIVKLHVEPPPSQVEDMYVGSLVFQATNRSFWDEKMRFAHFHYKNALFENPEEVYGDHHHSCESMQETYIRVTNTLDILEGFTSTELNFKYNTN